MRLYIIILSLSPLFLHHYTQWFTTWKPNHLKYILTRHIVIIVWIMLNWANCQRPFREKVYIKVVVTILSEKTFLDLHFLLVWSFLCSQTKKVSVCLPINFSVPFYQSHFKYSFLKKSKLFPWLFTVSFPRLGLKPVFFLFQLATEPEITLLNAALLNQPILTSLSLGVAFQVSLAAPRSSLTVASCLAA